MERNRLRDKVREGDIDEEREIQTERERVDKQREIANTVSDVE